MMRKIVGLTLWCAACLAPLPAAATIKVVTTLSSYASIAKWVGGDRVETHSISRGDEDAHFVKPKPSFALLLKDADLFVTTGLDLELWAPTLVDKSGNRRIRDGQPGFVSASQGVPLLDVPVVAEPLGRRRAHLWQPPHLHQPAQRQDHRRQYRGGSRARGSDRGRGLPKQPGHLQDRDRRASVRQVAGPYSGRRSAG